jgi:2-oxoisovalerate dehydrogenase E1 component
MRLRSYLIEKDHFSEEEISRIEAENSNVVEEAAIKVEGSADPDPSTATNFVIPPAYEHAQEDEPSTASPSDVPSYTLREAINETMKEEFRKNQNTFLWGQDVASREKGGVFNLTKGMQQEFGSKRVFNAPIAENFIVGTANGFSRYRDDLWVVIEGAQFADYFWPAMEQYVECTHEYYRTNGQFAPNIVMRLASGGYIAGGLYHSQSLDGTFATLPGARIVMPSFADDAVGLMRMAMRSRGLTVYLENKYLSTVLYEDAKTFVAHVPVRQGPGASSGFRSHTSHGGRRFISPSEQRASSRIATDRLRGRRPAPSIRWMLKRSCFGKENGAAPRRARAHAIWRVWR